MRRALILFAALGVSACSTGISKLPGVNAPSPTARAPVVRPPQRTTQPPGTQPPVTQPPGAFRSAPVQSAAGLEGMIGARATALTRRFGKARIDLIEGDARKLQFVSAQCVLDVYLYPREPRAEPTATHVEARSRTSGDDTDRARCIREVERGR